MTAVQKRPLRSSWRRTPVLRALGLPTKGCRWETAQPRLRQLMAQARRDHNDADAILLSQFKSFLKRVLPRSCGKCGAMVNCKSTLCKLCSCTTTAATRKKSATPRISTPRQRSIQTKDIAARAGLSLSTVQKSLRDLPDPNVAPATRCRIRALAYLLTYLQRYGDSSKSS